MKILKNEYQVTLKNYKIMLRHLSIRFAKKEDCNFVTHAVRQLIQIGENLQELPHVDNMDKCFDDLINDPKHSVIFVAEENGKQVGAAIVTFQNALHFGGRYAYLQELVIDPSARGLGVGSKMLKKIEEHAKENGMIGVDLCQPPSYSKFDKERSQFYEKNGYELGGVSRAKFFKPWFKGK